MGRNTSVKTAKGSTYYQKPSKIGCIPKDEGKIRIVVADSQKVVLEGIKGILALSKGLEIVGEAHDGKRALELVRELGPEILIIDVEMPQLNGIDVAADIIEQGLATKVLFFTIHSDKECIRKALDVKVSGYVLKDDPDSDLVQAIKTIASGATYYSKDFVKRVSEYIKELEKRVGEVDPYVTLSKREREVFRLLAEGRGIKDIAQLLYISPKTVESHKYNIMKKLGISSMGDLVRFAIREKIIKP